MTDMLTQDFFSALLNKTFDVQTTTGAVEAELIEVAALPNHQEQSRENWSLVFEFKTDDIYEQGTYTFQHEDDDEIAIFIVPIGQDEKGVRYQAIFN
ncbi:MAG: hypothetical protein MI754_12525 [Chromatiales bacterium]|nr:hypothetical protein [Chromatiales bacterium]